jgi:dihydrofolate synthase/folylpolyglutamate synthase
MTAYQECLSEMYSLRRFGIKLGLETIRSMLEGLGNPQKRFHCVHVAGTNGKGSVAANIAAVLSACGYLTGLYTSPHLVRFNERIQVDGQPIADADVVAAYQRVRNVQHADRQPTFFEFATAMALHEFARRSVEWAVIETGMGGRLDATNILMPAVAVITNISLEHREYLGDTLGRIAAEKAGIIKPGVPVVTGVRQKPALEVIAGVSAERSAPLYRLGRDFGIRSLADGRFNYRGLRHRWMGLRTALTGAHQRENAALTLAAIELLEEKAERLSAACIAEGLTKTRWPGRLQIVNTRPLTILDGAHNLQAARTLAKYLRTELAGRDITLVIGILDDKPHRRMLAALVPVSRRVIVTRPKTYRALAPEILQSEAALHCRRVTVISEVAAAVKQALADTPPEGAVCIAGSLYVVGEAMAALQGQCAPEPI